jgi:hypothetical protein
MPVDARLATEAFKAISPEPKYSNLLISLHLYKKYLPGTPPAIKGSE